MISSKTSMNEFNLIVNRAINLFGKEKQTLKAMEEVAELFQILSKTHFKGLVSRISLASEIADVEIMIAQLKIGYELHELVEQERASKLSRLMDIMDANVRERLNILDAEIRERLKGVGNE